MRIADLLISHATPGAVLVDLTSERAGASFAAEVPELGLGYRLGAADAPDGAIVLHSLGAAELSLELPALAHLVFFDRVEALAEHRLVERASAGGWEIAATAAIEHGSFRHVAVLRRATSPDVRVINESRHDKLLLEDSLRQRRELEVRATRLVDELAQLRASYQRVSQAVDSARADAARQRERATLLEARATLTQRRLESARRSLSFRIGRATKVAIESAGRNVLVMPQRWLETFRGPDEILDELVPETGTPTLTRSQAEAELAAIEPSVLLHSVADDPRPRPGIAGIVGPRLAAELDTTTRHRSLTPHAWRHLLEAEPPAFVLVTSDGLVPGTAWGDFGSPGGRDGAAMLAQLIDWCRARHLPVVYWDTDGIPGRLGVPRGLRFDGVFSVRRGHHAAVGGVAVETLAPAIAPRFRNPIGVAPTVPAHPIFSGGFDRDAERSALEALLRAGTARGLEILDANFGYQGPLAATVRFPDEITAPRHRRPALAAEATAIKAAGILLCGDGAGSSWELLRGLAMGVHVLATPSELGDPALAAAVSFAGDDASAAAALGALASRRRLDATWSAAFARLLADHTLRDRLDTIARHCGTVGVTERPPGVAVIARVRDGAELDALRGFLHAQTTPPVEIRVISVDGLDVATRLADAAQRSRLVVLRASLPGEVRTAADGQASHLLCWSPTTAPIAGAVSELTQLAILHGGDVLGLAPRVAGDDTTPTYHDGPLAAGTVVALRREAVAGRVRAGDALADVIASLTRPGARGLVKLLA